MFLSVRTTVADVVGASLEREQLAEAVFRYRSVIDAMVEGSQALIDDPDSSRPFLELMPSLGEVRAIGTLDVKCDRNGNGVLRHRGFAVSRGGKKRRFSKTEESVGDLDLAGVLVDRWDTTGEGWMFDADNLSSLQKRVIEVPHAGNPSATRTKPDPLRKYLRRFSPHIRDCTMVIISRLARNVPVGSCDVDPHCEYKRDCRLIARSGDDSSVGADVRGWWKRMVGVELTFLKSPTNLDKAHAMLAQMASLLRNLREERNMLEGALLRGLPMLPGKDKRFFLRRFLDYCRATEDPQLKGDAFERLANGVLRLVPGWIPGERGCFTEENQLDLAVMVEPALPSAKYWFEIFGPKIIVECKNYPKGLKTQIKGVNPVRKLHGNLCKSGVKLGLLLNTGPIPSSLKVLARQLSKSGNLLVLLNGEDLSRIVENPEDAEHFMKQTVSDAAIGAAHAPLPSAGRKRTATRKARRPTRPRRR